MEINKKTPSLTFAEILLHSPYEKMLDFGISQDEFLEYMQVVTAEYKTLGAEFISHFKIADGNKTFFFLTGFPGVGKTTFVNWLINVIDKNDKKTFNNDFSNIITEYINFSFEATSQPRYLERILSRVIKRNFPSYRKSLKFILENRKFLENDFYDFIEIKPIIEKILMIDAEKNEDEFNDLWKKMMSNLPPHALILLCLLDKSLKVIEGEDRFCFFCIDNLDALGSSYLLKGFWLDYFKAYRDMMSIANKMNWLDLRYRLKIVFVMRQYNYNLIRENINHHDYDVLQPYMQSNKYFIQKNLQKILELRKSYARNKNIIIGKRISSLIDVILSEDNVYREKLYLPLFNYDIRKINQKIIEIAVNDALLDFDFDKSIYDKLYTFQVGEKKPFRNGARGIILHCLIKVLFLSEEKYPIEPILEDVNSDSSVAFCSYCRMLMTVIFNLSYTPQKRMDRSLDNIDLIKPDTFGLDQLITAFRLTDSTDPLIPYESIFDWLRKFCNLKQNPFTHLIDIANKKYNIDQSIDFEEEFNISKIEKTSRLSNTQLHETKLRINPSGVIYLRYLICHFEFLAAYKYWKNDSFSVAWKPLYISTDFIHSKKAYEFEKTLMDVYKLVEWKKKSNDTFLTEQVFTGENRVKSVEDYLESNFTIHFDKGPNQLYSSRVIATHLRYIESFRNYINLDNEFISNVKHNATEYGGKTQEDLNLYILNIEERYVNLVLKSQRTVMDISIVDILRRWSLRISDIIQNRLYDTEIDIQIE